MGVDNHFPSLSHGFPLGRCRRGGVAISDTLQDLSSRLLRLGVGQWDPLVRSSGEQSGEQGREVREQPEKGKTPLPLP